MKYLTYPFALLYCIFYDIVYVLAHFIWDFRIKNPYLTRTFLESFNNTHGPREKGFGL